jgi:hypothetical protein
MNINDVFSRDWDLFDYSSLLEDDEENMKKKAQQGQLLAHIEGDPSLESFLPTSFDTQGTANAIQAIDAMMGAGAVAPTGINPAAPPESQPPAVGAPPVFAPSAMLGGPPAPSMASPNKYERMEGVTSIDSLSAVAMGMTAIGTKDFARVYGGLQAGLVQKQKTADEYNMALDLGTKPETKISGNNIVTLAPKYIRNSDGTYSLNPDAGAVLDSKNYGTSGSTGQAYNTYLAMKQNGDIPPDTTWNEFQTSPAFDPFRTDYMRKVNNTEAYLRGIGIDDRNLASQMAAGALKIEDMEGGGIKVFDLAGNVVQEITSPEEAQGFKQAYEQAGSYGSKSGESAVTDLKEYETRFRELAIGADAIISGIENARNVMSLYDGDDGEPIDSNVARGMMARFFGIGDEDMGMLMGMETEALLEALQTTTLVPVSDADIRALRSMFASVTDNPELAMGKLKSFMMAKERQLRFDRDQFRRELDRLGDNRNILNPAREIESFKNTYRYLYDFETNEEFLERTGGE